MYNSWWANRKNFKQELSLNIIILFPILSVVSLLRDAPKSIRSKPKWGAQAVVKEGTPPWPPRSDDTAVHHRVVNAQTSSGPSPKTNLKPKLYPKKNKNESNLQA